VLVAHRDPGGDVLDRDGLLVVGLLCPTALCGQAGWVAGSFGV
jgi:hypothetical protein